MLIYLILILGVEGKNVEYSHDEYRRELVQTQRKPSEMA